MSTARLPIPTKPWVRWTARFIAVGWALFWVWFGLASGIGEGLEPLGVLLHATFPGLIFLLFALLIWRWEWLGGAMLVLSGIVVAIAYPMTFGVRFPVATVVFVLLTMALPPFIAGVLALINWRVSHPRGQPA